MRILAVALVVLLCAPLAGSFPAFAQSAEPPASLLDRIRASAPPPQSEAPAAQNADDYAAFFKSISPRETPG